MKKIIFLFLLGLVGCGSNTVPAQMRDTALENRQELAEFYAGMSKLKSYCKEVASENQQTNNTVYFERCDCAVDVLSAGMIEAKESKKAGKYDNQAFENAVAEKMKQQCGGVPNIFF